jgi:hypothetical protein
MGRIATSITIAMSNAKLRLVKWIIKNSPFPEFDNVGFYSQHLYSNIPF